MNIKPNFEVIDVADEHVVVALGEDSIAFGGVVVVSEAAAFLLRELKNRKSRNELIDILTAEYDVDEITAKTDVEKWISVMLDMGVIEE